MASALNNLKKVDMPFNKEAKEGKSDLQRLCSLYIYQIYMTC